MRKLVNKIVFVINSIAAFALLLSYLLPYVSPKAFPLLSILSIAVPVFIVINLLFLLYWSVMLNRRLILSLVVLILGFSHVSSMYKISGDSARDISKGINLFTFNVHSFNRFKWIASETIPQEISALIKEKNPDIFCAQEFYDNPNSDFTQYPYQFQEFNNDNGELALVIFSKYPIISKGSLQFENTWNNAIFADIKVDADTIRVYNTHLQSHRINPDTDELTKEDSQKLLKRIQVSFEKQQDQVELLIEHLRTSPYKNVVMGDFNNTAYSYVYNQVISEGLIDAFKEEGSGFGKTFEFDLFPVRIDFILVSQELEVLTFDRYELELSDHYPISTQIQL